MNTEKIKSTVEGAIHELSEQFRKGPALFYNENDLVCRFYHLLQDKLDWAVVEDRENRPHYLVHRGYPTPFRCDMSGYGFEIKCEHDRTADNGKYTRGQYDVVVLNPQFLRSVHHAVACGHDYELVTGQLAAAPAPAVLYGVEFMLNGNPLKYSRGEDRHRGLKDFCQRVLQDYRKLQNSRVLRGKTLLGGLWFMDRVTMLVFDNASPQEIRRWLRTKLDRYVDVRLCFSDIAIDAP